jgi:DNA-binding transcriptional regulator YdaS (Cro superfamily)
MSTTIDARELQAYSSIMDINAVIKFYGSQSALAAACQVERQVVWNWQNRKAIPAARQLQIAELTQGKFKPDRRPWE